MGRFVRTGFLRRGRKTNRDRKDAKALVLTMKIVTATFSFRMNEFRTDRRPLTCRAGLHRPCRNFPPVVNPGFVHLYPFYIPFSATDHVHYWLAGL